MCVCVLKYLYFSWPRPSLAKQMHHGLIAHDFNKLKPRWCLFFPICCLRLSWLVLSVKKNVRKQTGASKTSQISLAHTLVSIAPKEADIVITSVTSGLPKWPGAHLRPGQQESWFQQEPKTSVQTWSSAPALRVINCAFETPKEKLK